MSTPWLIACSAATFFMTGLIWFVQAVHYPLFAEVGREEFVKFHAAHSRRTTYVVLGPMVVELVTSLAMAFRPPLGVPGAIAWWGLAASALTWISTAAVQVPLHGRLSIGYDLATIRLLVRTNFVRSAAWTFHSGMMVWMLYSHLNRI